MVQGKSYAVMHKGLDSKPCMGGNKNWSAKEVSRTVGFADETVLH